jgi:hypothetical protein
MWRVSQTSFDKVNSFIEKNFAQEQKTENIKILIPSLIDTCSLGQKTAIGNKVTQSIFTLNG